MFDVQDLTPYGPVVSWSDSLAQYWLERFRVVRVGLRFTMAVRRWFFSAILTYYLRVRRYGWYGSSTLPGKKESDSQLSWVRRYALVNG